MGLDFAFGAKLRLWWTTKGWLREVGFDRNKITLRCIYSHSSFSLVSQFIIRNVRAVDTAFVVQLTNLFKNKVEFELQVKVFSFIW